MANKFTLPLISPAPQAATLTSWHGLTVDGQLPPADKDRDADSPEPQAPQGAYNAAAPEAPLLVPLVECAKTQNVVELLTPAGGLESAFAAFHYGADAIYLGLKKFSARAEAENFTLEEVDEVTAYAHALQPPRRVFVTINTLIRQDELSELIEALAALVEIGVDAVIVQDLGVYRAVRQFFPTLELHGSTQMAVHNRAGAETLHQLGFRRVVLARELTYEEVNDITNAAGVETEVFIHGALCYSYSGLCLFSAQTLGRSGNRGKCAYSCRDSYEVAGAPTTLRDGRPVQRDPGQGFPFSMKDLALPDHLPALRAAGVSCFKIEGRKKSPLYVATTTDYYRKLLDGDLKPEDRPVVEADLQTVFSRPWTRLFVQSYKDKEVADRDTVGHRGTCIGRVEAVVPASPAWRAEPRKGPGPGGEGNTARKDLSRSDPRMRFHTERALQRHDGLQIDLPILGKPFGFAVTRLWLVGGKRQDQAREVLEAPANSMVEVTLPADHPDLPIGAPVYCSSSQHVKQKYRYHRPKPRQWHGRLPLHIDATLTEDRLVVVAMPSPPAPLPLGERETFLPSPPGRGAGGEGHPLQVQHQSPGPFPRAEDEAAMEQAARACFARLGQSRFSLASLSWKNEAGGFIPVSRLNQIRREVVAAVETALQQQRQAKIEQIQQAVAWTPCCSNPPATKTPAGSARFRWSIKVDRSAFLDAFEDEDWREVDEVIVEIARDHATVLRDKLTGLAKRIGREKIRLALPPLTRAWEEKGLRHKIELFRADGWQKWEAANLSAWHYLGLDPHQPNPNIDLASDWSLYVINRLAAQQVLSMGVTRFALSPEDGFANARTLWTEFGQRAVLIVYQDTPQFLAESCAYANLIGGCPGKANCRFESMEMVSSHGERVTALDYHCRTIVLNQGPFCLSPRLRELAQAGARALRADFIYRHYDPPVVRDRWRRIRAGQSVSGGHSANFESGLL